MKIFELEKIQDLTYEMMSAFNDGLSWIIGYCEKNNLPMPDLDQVRGLISTSSYVLENSEHANTRRRFDRTSSPHK